MLQEVGLFHKSLYVSSGIKLLKGYFINLFSFPVSTVNLCICLRCDNSN